MPYQMSRSNTVGRVPASLAFGQIAYNDADRIIFVGGVTGAPVPFPLSVAAILANAALTGKPTAPDPAVNDNTAQVPNTRWIQSLVGAFALLASPALTGSPTAPTATAGSTTTQIATTAFASAAAASITGQIGAKSLSSYPGATPTAKLQTWAASGDRKVYIDQDFTLTATVVLPNYGQIFGGSHIITKGFNGDMFDMSAQSCAVHDFYLAGGRAAGGWLGRGVVIGGSGVQATTTSKQRLFNVDIVDMDGYCLEYTAPGAGGQSAWIGGSASRYMPLVGGSSYQSQNTLAAIKLPGNGTLGDASNDPQTYGIRRFVNLDGNGTTLIDFAGGNITEMLFCASFQSLYRAATRYAKWIGGRHVQAPTLLGIGNYFDSNVTIDGGNGPLTLGAGCIENIVRLGTNNVTWLDQSGNNSNQIWDNVPRPFTATFAPVVQSPSGFSLGNGTLTGSMTRRGGQIDIKVKLLWGSTTAVSGHGAWNFALPAPYSSLFPKSADAIALARSTQTGYTGGMAVMAAGSASISIYPLNGTGTALGDQVPAAMAAGEDISFNLTFDID